MPLELFVIVRLISTGPSMFVAVIFPKYSEGIRRCNVGISTGEDVGLDTVKVSFIVINPSSWRVTVLSRAISNSTSPCPSV